MARFSTLAIFIAVLALTANAAPAEPAPVAAPAAAPVAAPVAAPAKALSPECVALKQTFKEARHAAKLSLSAIPTTDKAVKASVDEALKDMADIKELHHEQHGAMVKAATFADKIAIHKETKEKVHKEKAEIRQILKTLKTNADKAVAEKAADSLAKFKALHEAKTAFMATCFKHHHHKAAAAAAPVVAAAKAA